MLYIAQIQAASLLACGSVIYKGQTASPHLTAFDPAVWVAVTLAVFICLVRVFK